VKNPNHTLKGVKIGIDKLVSKATLRYVFAQLVSRHSFGAICFDGTTESFAFGKTTVMLIPASLCLFEHIKNTGKL
jgi:hypothetical protein